MKAASLLLLPWSVQWAVGCGASFSKPGDDRALDEFIADAFAVNFTSGNIVGGFEAEEYTSFGFSVGDYLCGGTLIHDDIFLTAAHCQTIFLDGVFLGGTKIDGSGSVEIMVLDEIPHEDFADETYENDIMIVKLAWPPPPESNVTIQELNFDIEMPRENDILSAIGYGYTKEFGSVSNALLEVQLDIVSHEFCDDYYGTIIEETMVCTLTESKDTCLGDSGGPLMDENGVQVAVTSFGRGCARTNVPGVYTRVAVFQDWIESMICTHSDYPKDSCNSSALTALATELDQPTRAPVSMSTNPSFRPSGTASESPLSQPSDTPSASPLSQPSDTPSASPQRATLNPTRQQQKVTLSHISMLVSLLPSFPQPGSGSTPNATSDDLGVATENSEDYNSSDTDVQWGFLETNGGVLLIAHETIAETPNQIDQGLATRVHDTYKKDTTLTCTRVEFN